MNVTVIPANTDMPTLAFADSRGWHVDGDLTLHVRGAKGNLASFGPHCWAGVYDADSASAPTK